MLGILLLTLLWGDVYAHGPHKSPLCNYALLVQEETEQWILQSVRVLSSQFDSPAARSYGLFFKSPWVQEDIAQEIRLKLVSLAQKNKGLDSEKSDPEKGPGSK